MVNVVRAYLYCIVAMDQVQYSTPDQSKSGLACHMTRSTNHRRHSGVIQIKG